MKAQGLWGRVLERCLPRIVALLLLMVVGSTEAPTQRATPHLEPDTALPDSFEVVISPMQSARSVGWQLAGPQEPALEPAP